MIALEIRLKALEDRLALLENELALAERARKYLTPVFPPDPVWAPPFVVTCGPVEAHERRDHANEENPHEGKR